MARLQRVFIDTSELFPFTIMDVLLSLSEDFLFAWVWTDEVLDEWEEVIVRDGQRNPESAALGAWVSTHPLRPAPHRSGPLPGQDHRRPLARSGRPSSRRGGHLRRGGCAAHPERAEVRGATPAIARGVTVSAVRM